MSTLPSNPQSNPSLMTIDVFTKTGTKSGTMSLPETLFAAPIHHGLIQQAVLLQQGNAKQNVAHVKTRSEVRGSTRKLYMQKHTGRARRGSVRSPVLRGGGKAFGPRNLRTFEREMPKAMRHAALRACLTLQANKKIIMGLEGFNDDIKTKAAHTMLEKMSVNIGRPVLIVTSEKNASLTKSTRNIPGVKTLLASYLNPIDVLGAHHIIFVTGAVERAVEVFAKKSVLAEDGEPKPKAAKKPAAKKSSPKNS